MKVQSYLKMDGLDLDSKPLYELSLHTDDASFIMHELPAAEIIELINNIQDYLILMEEKKENV